MSIAHSFVLLVVAHLHACVTAVASDWVQSVVDDAVELVPDPPLDPELEVGEGELKEELPVPVPEPSLVDPLSVLGDGTLVFEPVVVPVFPVPPLSVAGDGVFVLEPLPTHSPNLQTPND